MIKQTILYKGILLCTILFTLSGCVKYVDVPVWVCPSPNLPKKEILMTSKLDNNSDTDLILKSLVYDVTYLQVYSKQLEVLLQGYKKEPNTKFDLIK